MNQQALSALLQRLDAVAGVSGFEENAGSAISEEISGCYDEHRTDMLGSHLFIKKGRAASPSVLLIADIDEPGFLLSGITPSGLLLLLPVGPPPSQPLQNQGYLLYTAQGILPAVCGDSPLPAGKDPVQGPVLVLDVGARSRKAAENMGIAIGDLAISDRRGRRMGKSLFSGRAADGHAGCAALIAAMQLLKGAATQATVTACAAVQGRLGGRGLLAAAQAVSPQLILRFGAADESTHSPLAFARLGEGPAIRIYGGTLSGTIPPLPLLRQLEGAARARHLPWQLEAAPPAVTTLPAPPGLCIPAGEIGIPCRYRDSAVSIVDMNDILNAARLAAAFLEQLEKL